MKIAVVTDTSTAAKNKAVIDALTSVCKADEVYNVGMKGSPLDGKNEPSLLIYDTAFISALLLNLKCVDFVVGGCGTGQGYFNCVLQFPDITCGLIIDAVDAWVYPRINAGNCISLALNKGYGWAGEKNLEFIFEKLFSSNFGEGYPPERREPQNKIREKLALMSQCVHKDFSEIVHTIDKEIFDAAVCFPGVIDFIKTHARKKNAAYKALLERIGE